MLDKNSYRKKLKTYVLISCLRTTFKVLVFYNTYGCFNSKAPMLYVCTVLSTFCYMFHVRVLMINSEYVTWK